MSDAARGPVVVAIGHSTRSAADFVALLRENGVASLADVRATPRSWRNPQFDQAALRRTLEDAGIRYVHVPELGGRRETTQALSRHHALRDPAFRAYAEHMETAEFADGLARVLALADDGPVAVMCAERDPANCHRNLVCDALFARGVVARHVVGPGGWTPHEPSPAARVEDGAVVYDRPRVRRARRAPPDARD